MHVNSAYSSGIVLMCALFSNLDYLLWYQKTFFCGHWFLPEATLPNQEQRILVDIMNLKRKKKKAATSTSDILTLSESLVKEARTRNENTSDLHFIFKCAEKPYVIIFGMTFLNSVIKKSVYLWPPLCHVSIS